MVVMKRLLRDMPRGLTVVRLGGHSVGPKDQDEAGRGELTSIPTRVRGREVVATRPQSIPTTMPTWLPQPLKL